MNNTLCQVQPAYLPKATVQCTYSQEKERLELRPPQANTSFPPIYIHRLHGTPWQSTDTRRKKPLLLPRSREKSQGVITELGAGEERNPLYTAATISAQGTWAGPTHRNILTLMSDLQPSSPSALGNTPSLISFTFRCARWGGACTRIQEERGCRSCWNHTKENSLG